MMERTKKTARAVVLFSGGMDSMLAAAVLKRQGVRVEAMCVLMPYHDSCESARRAAEQLGVPFCARWVEQDYFAMLRSPRHGRGSAANPCTDCHAYMARMAHRRMLETGADFVATGDVLGQRPCSQKRMHLDIIMKRSGLGDRLLRPLSAKLLPQTLPEREGMVGREGLYEFSGRRRNGLLELAEELGILLPASEKPDADRRRLTPSSGCRLTLKDFAPRFFDVFENLAADRADGWHYGTLGFGRHFRLTPTTKVVVARNESEGGMLERFFHHPSRRDAAMMMPLETGFTGPTVLILGEISAEACQLAGGLLLWYAKEKISQTILFYSSQPGVVEPELRVIEPVPEAATMTML